MNSIEEIKKRILEDDEFVLAEAQKILYLYTLKHTIRYGQSRQADDYTESVAEHIYGMHVISDYFLPLKHTNDTLDQHRIKQLISWHELGEIETGDIPNVIKTHADRIREAELLPTIVKQTPTHIQTHIQEVVTEYEEQTSAESKFVKAIDKIEPLIHSLHPLGKVAQQELKLSVESSISAKTNYIMSYPTIQRFSDVLHEYMHKEGYFFQN